MDERKLLFYAAICWLNVLAVRLNRPSSSALVGESDEAGRCNTHASKKMNYLDGVVIYELNAGVPISLQQRMKSCETPPARRHSVCQSEALFKYCNPSTVSIYLGERDLLDVVGAALSALGLIS